MQTSSSRHLSLPLVAMLAAGLYATAPSAAAAQPAAKDVGMFGNFEIGPGFGAQSASGFAGVVAGVTDGGTYADSLRFLGYEDRRAEAKYARTTLEGETYYIHTIGRENIDEGYIGHTPSHKITVTAPVGVRFEFKMADEYAANNSDLMLYGRDIRVRQRFTPDTNADGLPGYFTLELLPGEYEIYTAFDSNYGENKNPPYTLTLVEQHDLMTHRSMTVQPGFGEIKAAGIALHAGYGKSPMMQAHELTVTEPMMLELTAFLDIEPNYSYYGYFFRDNIRIALKGENTLFWKASSGGFDPRDEYILPPELIKYRSLPSWPSIDKSFSSMVVPLQPGQYQVNVATTGEYTSPNPYRLTLRENTELKPRHITVGEGFTSTRVRGAWAPGVHYKKEGYRPEILGCAVHDSFQHLDISPPHRLTVTSPQMAAIKVATIEDDSQTMFDSSYYNPKHTDAYGGLVFDYKGKEITPILRRISGEERSFCDSTGERLSSFREMNLFLAPGEYELYLVGSGEDNGIAEPRLYDIFIEPQQ